jgi:hypothetical protein
VAALGLEEFDFANTISGHCLTLATAGRMRVKLVAQAPRQEDSESVAVVWKHAA